MRIEKLTVGELATNCFLVWEEENEEALIIDPGDSGDFISEKILFLKLRPKMILLTHAHFDHVLAALELQLAFKIPLAMSKKDESILAYMQKSARFWLRAKNEPPSPPPKVDKFLDEGDRIRLGKSVFKVLATPGHTPGSLSFYSVQEKAVFTGDTLFANGVGRTDLPGSSAKELKKSLKKLLALPGKTRVLPGHGPETTIGQEKKVLKDGLMI
jgi:glyoxylase-like metal-dependent hydrolase (beta-lactamase superfamily II)